MDPDDPILPAGSGSAGGRHGTSREIADERPAAKYVDFADREPADKSAGRDARATPRQLTWLLLLPLGFTFFLTCLFLGMRGILDLGGMVAVGGPYEIAHPAPSWWWIIPLSISACVLIILFSVFNHSLKEKGNLVLALFWPAIFISLGWNFLEYGFFKTGGLAWGWIICGLVFVPMGALPLFYMLRAMGKGAWSEWVGRSWRSLLPQLAGIALGIPLGILFFSAVS